MLPTVIVITWKEIGLSWFQRLVIYRQILMPTNHKLTGGCDKSFADDLVASRYCKHESSLCATICWDFSCVPTICSSIFWVILVAITTVCQLFLKFSPHLKTHLLRFEISLFLNFFFRVDFFLGRFSKCWQFWRWPRMGTVAILAQGTLSGCSEFASLMNFLQADPRTIVAVLPFSFCELEKVSKVWPLVRFVFVPAGWRIRGIGAEKKEVFQSSNCCSEQFWVLMLLFCDWLIVAA